MKIVEVACATPASFPTRKLPLVMSIFAGVMLPASIVFETVPVSVVYTPFVTVAAFPPMLSVVVET